MSEKCGIIQPLTAGRVYAFDSDNFRLKRLKANCQSAGAGSIVKAKCGDFLEVGRLHKL